MLILIYVVGYACLFMLVFYALYEPKKFVFNNFKKKKRRRNTFLL